MRVLIRVVGCRRGVYSIALMTSSPRTAYCADVTCMECEAAADSERIGITLAGGWRWLGGWMEMVGGDGWRWLGQLDWTQGADRTPNWIWVE
jgi:hypothetical protein